jgi:hypothetical protein
MIQIKSRSKIRLSREVLRNLNADEAKRVAGGIIRTTPDSKPYACPSSNDPTAC